MNYKQPSWLNQRHEYKRITDEQLSSWRREAIEIINSNDALHKSLLNMHRKLLSEATAFYGAKSGVVNAMKRARIPAPPDLDTAWDKLKNKVQKARVQLELEALEQQHQHQIAENRSEGARRGWAERKRRRIEAEREEYVNSIPQSD